VGLCAAFFAWYPISDGDIFWHLAAGREIAHSHAVPYVDPFSFTSVNFQWIDLHWFFQLCMYGMFRFFGMTGILIANSFCFGLAAAILFRRTASRGTVWFSVLLWTIALFEVRYLAPHRPIMFSLVFCALFFYCLDRYNSVRKLRYLVFLPVIQILWVNSQPLFVLGPVIIAAWLAGDAASAFLSRNSDVLRRIMTLSCALAATVIASLANPFGVAAYKLAFMLFGRTDPSSSNLFAVAIAENKPLWWMLHTPDAHYAYATIAITAFALLLISIRPRAIKWPVLVVAAAMFFLALRAERNIILYFFLVLPFINFQLGHAYEALKTRFPRCAAGTVITGSALLFLIAGFSIGGHAAMLRSVRCVGSIAPFSFPSGSVDFLDAHPVKGALFNADRYGGYLLWQRYPVKKVFIDTRYAIRPPAFLAEYCALLDDPGLFDAVCAKYGITAAVMPTALTTRYFNLTTFLLKSGEWKPVYIDGAEALFVKNNALPLPGLDLDRAATIDSLAFTIVRKWRCCPGLQKEALRHFADFLLTSGKKESADCVVAFIGHQAH
jgi:hypothetical protein